MKKKILASLLVIALILSSFTMVACGNGDGDVADVASDDATDVAEDAGGENEEEGPDLDQYTSEDEKEIIFWNLWGGGDGVVLQEMVEYFNENNPDGIRVISLTQDWGMYYTKLRTAVVGNQAPDLAMSHVTRIYELATNQVIVPLDEAFAQAGLSVDFNQITSGVMENSIIDGVYYGLPVDNLILTLQFNKEVLESTGFLGDDGQPLIGNNFEDFVDVLTSIEEQGYIALQAYQTGFMTQIVWYTLYKQLGGTRFLADDLQSVELDYDLAVLAAEYLSELYSFTPPHVETNATLFAEGNTAFMIDGSWAVSSIAALIDDFGVVKFPQFFDNNLIWTDSHAFVLPNKPQRTENETRYALIFVQWFHDNSWKWAEAGHLPANTASWEHPQFIANEFVHAYSDAGNYGVAFPSTDSVWLTFAAEFSEPFEALVNEGADPEETIDLMIRNLDRELSR